MEYLESYQNYAEYEKAVDTVVNRMSEDFVLMGYQMKIGRDTEILKESGYANINEFAWDRYHLDASQVSRFIKINDRFSEGGYSKKLQEKYRGYGYAKLALMLTMPMELNEELSPAFSKSEIQEVKEEIEQEQKISDIEVMLEGQTQDQKERDSLGQVLYQLFRDEPKLFQIVYDTAKESGFELKRLKEVLTPSGEKVYSVRIQGVGRQMLFLRDGEEKVTVFHVRSNEKEYYEWEDVRAFIQEEVNGQEAKERWEDLYGESFPEEKEEIAPVQPEEKKPKPRKESKVKKAKIQKEEKKTDERDKNVSGHGSAGVHKEVEKQEAKTSEKEPERPETLNVEPISVPEEITGQMELIKDFPEYCPEDMNLPEKPINTECGTESGQQETTKYPYGSRKQYLDTLTEYGAALYIAAHMANLRNITFPTLLNPEYWEKWLRAKVDEKGEEIDVVE